MPTPDQVRRALELMAKRGANSAYFFERLDSPDWIDPLLAEGFFQKPPPPERDGDYVRFPVWPESRYLARMAPLAPDVVHRVIMSIPDTANERVHEDLLEAASTMPPRLARDIAQKETDWIRTRPWVHLLLPDKARSVARALTEAGETSAALALISSLLEVTGRSGTHAAGRLRSWDYSEVVRLSIPMLVRADARNTLETLRVLLQAALDERAAGAAPDFEDYSFIWRPVISDEEGESPREDIESSLVSAVRDAAKAAIELGLLQPLEVVDILQAAGRAIFSRLAMYTLKQVTQPGAALIDRFLCNRSLFDSSSVRADYVALARTKFGEASPECQQTILSWIDEGPPEDRITKRADSLGVTESSEEIDMYKRIWQRDRLTPIVKFLDEARNRSYDQLVSELGRPSDEDFLPFRMWSGFGPADDSPVTPETLRAMSDEDLVRFVNSWTAPDDPRGPSYEGMGSLLRQISAEEGERMAKVAGRFVGSSPIYVREVLSGLTEYIKSHAIDWDGVLELAVWAAANKDKILEDRLSRRADREYSWAAHASLDLVRDGMLRSPSGLELSGREGIWSVIANTVDDAEPTPEHEKEYLAENWDALGLSLNTTRGKAFDAVMCYLIWLNRCLGEDREGKDLSADAPEAFDVLVRHLDIGIEPSLAIRSVYGRRFPWLVHVAPDWAGRLADTIFPVEPELRAYWDAAWSSYLTNPTVIKVIVRMLDRQYRHAIEVLGTLPEAKGSRLDVDERLAQQLMVLYLHGDLELSGDLLQTFYMRASDKVRADAMDFVGREATADLSPQMTSRAKALWESRLGVILSEPKSHTEEMRAFGWFFVSPVFDEEWLLQNLERVLKFGVGVDADWQVVERLADVAKREPLVAVTCLRQLLKADREEWDVYTWRDSVRAVLQQALKTSESRDIALQVLNELMTEGHFEYRELATDNN